MPDKAVKCKTPNCRASVKKKSVSGICRSCSTAARMATLSRCVQCDAHLYRDTKGSLCGCCISIRAQKNRKFCKVCHSDLMPTNKTGFCWHHFVKDQAEKVAEKHEIGVVRPFTVAQLVTAAAFATSSSEDEIKTDRFKFFCRVRFAIAHLAKPYFSTIQIGKMLGGKDHSTIIHAQCRALDLMADNGFKTLVRTIEQEALKLAERQRMELMRIAA